MKPSELVVPRDLREPREAAVELVASRRRRALAFVAERLGGYATLVKLRVNLMVLLVAGIGFYLGSQGPVVAVTLIHCLIGTAMLGAGASALNQYLERQTDGLMARTEDRPLPRGRLHPIEALALGLILGIGGVLVLALLVGAAASLLGAATFLSYVVLYTPLKRITPHSLFIGAVPGALPPLIGWSAASGSVLAPEAWSLFAILFVWQIPHFLAIAWLHRRDYRTAGVPTLAEVAPEDGSLARWMLFSSLLLVATTLIPLGLGVRSLLYVAGATLSGLAFLAAVGTFARDLSESGARMVVRASLVHLPLVYSLIVLDRVVEI